MRTLKNPFKTPLKTLLVALAAAAAITVPADASARGRHHHGGGRAHFGLFIGAPLLLAPFFYGPRYYYPPAYYPPAYYPPVVMAPPPPPAYVEQPQTAAPGQASDGYWYYCPSSQAYYPGVSQCAQPWQRVAPTS